MDKPFFRFSRLCGVSLRENTITWSFPLLSVNSRYGVVSSIQSSFPTKKCKKERTDLMDGSFFFELVGQNCNLVKSRILYPHLINIEIIPLNTVLVNKFLKSFCKIIETLSYYFLYLMYKYRLKRGKPILSLSFYATSIFRNSSSA